jgi:phosphate transport system permease protein
MSDAFEADSGRAETGEHRDKESWVQDVAERAQRLVDSVIREDRATARAALAQLKELQADPRVHRPAAPSDAAQADDVTPAYGIARSPAGSLPDVGQPLTSPSAVAVLEAEPNRPDPRPFNAVSGLGDRIFRSGSTLAGLSVLALMGAVGLLLLLRALSAIRIAGPSFLTRQEWEPGAHHFGIAAVLAGTVLIALVAMAVAVPFAIGTALFIAEVAPRQLKGALISIVDLMAAVPSVVYGIWGLFYLQGHVIGLSKWLTTWFGWIPFLHVNGADPTNPLASKSVYTGATFIAGLVVAMMAMPIACSVMREVFSQAPTGEREGAYALGATRWGMIRSVVLPFGKGGMIGGAMLGLGRALGETIAVVLIISPQFKINFHILQSGSNSVASLITLRYGDASSLGLSALMAAGLALFVLTLIVNFSASVIVAKARSGAESEA